MNKQSLRRGAVASLSALAVWASAMAADVNVCLHLASGEKMWFGFADHPVMTFDGSSLTMSDKTGKVTVLDCSALHKITFDENGGVDGVTSATSGVVSARAGVVTLDGFDEGTPVSVASVSGQQMFAGSVPESGTLTVDLTDRAPGVYIVTAGAVSCKVTNR